jgi:hypothetical protein
MQRGQPGVERRIQRRCLFVRWSESACTDHMISVDKNGWPNSAWITWADRDLGMGGPSHLPHKRHGSRGCGFFGALGLSPWGSRSKDSVHLPARYARAEVFFLAFLVVLERTCLKGAEPYPLIGLHRAKALGRKGFYSIMLQAGKYAHAHRGASIAKRRRRTHIACRLAGYSRRGSRSANLDNRPRPAGDGLQMGRQANV